MSEIKTFIKSKLPKALSTYHFLLAWSSAKLHRHPSKNIFVIGVTGTKGKTTTLELLNAILEVAGKKTALLSSLRAKAGDYEKKNPTGNSMPGRGYIQKFLKRAVDAGCTYAIIEVTSQGVVQHRHKFIDWNIGVLTNLSPEHIESHGSFENYRAAKLNFLKYVLARGGKVFLNEDDPHFPFFTDALTKTKTVPYTMRGDTISRYLPHDTPVRDAVAAPHDMEFVLSEFNKSNIACAIGVAKELGIEDEVIARAIENFKGVPGRFDLMRMDGYTAIADYAHTPDSLEAAYKAARELLPKNDDRAKLICVLGACGGGRDTWKRPEFGKIAAQYCDEIILTEEDPYDEDPAHIIEQIKSGISEVGSRKSEVREVSSRRNAIKLAVERARPGDVIIGTGKGSEDWIHYAHGKKMPWNEKRELEFALMAKKDGTLTAPKEEIRIEKIKEESESMPSPDVVELPWLD